MTFPAFPPTPGGDGDIGSRESGSPSSKPMLDHQASPTVVETPTSPFSACALSRFEFENGRGNEGTKILMVEWSSTAAAAAAAAAAASNVSGAGGREQQQGEANRTCQQHQSGLENGTTFTTTPTATATSSLHKQNANDWADWEVTWDGKTDTNAVPVRSAAGAGAEDGATMRMYFLLPPGHHIPPLVSIRHRGGSDSAVLWTKPMPAIFPAGLGGGRGDLGDTAAAATTTITTTTTTTTGQRGVLHTIWAKQRLADLTAEIAAEMKANSESVGLQITIQEHAWIAEHFGVVCHSENTTAETEAETKAAAAAAASALPSSPRLPSPQDGRNTSKLGEKLKGLRLATSPAELEAASRAVSANLWTHAHARQQQQQQHTGSAHISSLDAVMQGNRSQPAAETDADGEDELFALPLSPRSPDMIKSPFSVL